MAGEEAPQQLEQDAGEEAPGDGEPVYPGCAPATCSRLNWWASLLIIVDHGAIIDPIKMSESYKRKLPDLLQSSFEKHKKKQRIMRATKRKSKF